MLRRFSADKRGASALEFALVAPVFLLFLFGIFYTSWAAYGVANARFAIAETGRALQMNQRLTASDLDAIFKSKMNAGLMTIQDLVLDTSGSQSGLALAKLRVPIAIKLKIPFLDEVTIDCSASTQVALSAI